jgi:hypothetical protein
MDREAKIDRHSPNPPAVHLCSVSAAASGPLAKVKKPSHQMQYQPFLSTNEGLVLLTKFCTMQKNHASPWGSAGDADGF